MTLNDIFTEVYNHFINGNYSVANPKNRDQKKNIVPPKMESEQALRHTANYLLWEWANDNNDENFKCLINVICLPPTDYDLSKFTLKQLLEVICPEVIKTNPGEF